MADRRTNERKRVVLEAHWKSVSRKHEARVDDVSFGGCFVNTYGHVELDEPVELQILTPAGQWLNLRGTVVTYQPGVGFGMEFSSLTKDEERTLKKLIDSAVERPL